MTKTISSLIFVSALIVFLLLNSYVQLASCDTVNIIPTPNTPCPEGERCVTLQQFVANLSLSPNTTMNFYPGEHLMPSSLIVANVNSFSMRATENVTIFCTLPWCHPSFVFHDLITVQIRGITFNSCEFNLYGVTERVEIVKSSFVNHTAPQCGDSGGVLVFNGNAPVFSVLIKQCTFSDNTGESGVIFDALTKDLTVDQCTFKNNHGSSWIAGAIFKNGGFIESQVRILNSYFIHNRAKGIGGAVSIGVVETVYISNCHFIDNVAGRDAGAVDAFSSQVIITKSYFNKNVARSKYGNGGALYAYVSEGGLNITDSYFSDNAAGYISGKGGAVYNAISTNEVGNNIIISGNTFANNFAIGGGGGAIILYIDTAVVYRSCNISLTGNTFIDNTAAYCGAVQITKDQHSDYYLNATISKNSFTHNSAAGIVAGNDTGGALCIRNAQYALVLDSTFSHNKAAGNAGAMQVDDSNNMTIKRSSFSRNLAGGDGGVLFTRSLSTNYTITITDSNFTYNKVGGDGGVLFTRSLSTNYTITDSNFTYNNAWGNGGVLYMETAKSRVKIRRGNFAFNYATNLTSNKPGGYGGVLFTRSLSTNYTITDSNFTYNKAWGDGGVLYMETVKSQVKIRRGNFAFNQAIDRGGAIAINGTDLSISGASVCEENTAKLGGVVSACKSKVKISNPNIPPTPDPVYSFCSLYDCTNAMHST